MHAANPKDSSHCWEHQHRLGLKNKINDSRGLLVSKDLAGGRIARVLFCIEPDCIVLLHGFMKKAQKTPQQEIDLAIKRMKGERG